MRYAYVSSLKLRPKSTKCICNEMNYDLLLTRHLITFDKNNNLVKPLVKELNECENDTPKEKPSKNCNYSVNDPIR